MPGGGGADLIFEWAMETEKPRQQSSIIVRLDHARSRRVQSGMSVHALMSGGGLSPQQ